MNDLHSYIQVGIVHFMAYPQAANKPGGVLESVLSIVRDEFFSAIELTSVADETEREEVRRVLESSGLTVCFAAQPILLGNKANINSLDEDERSHALGLMKKAIDDAYALDATRFALLSGPDPGEADRARATELLVDSLRQICAYARERGDMTVALETFDRDIDKKCLVGPHSLAIEVSQQVREVDPTFGLLLDLSHFPLQHESTRDALETAKGHLTHAHMGNCYMNEKSDPAYGDLHPRFGYAGGENDVAELTEYLQELFCVGYLGEGKRGIISFEVKPLAGESSDAIVAQSKRKLLEAWRGVQL